MILLQVEPFLVDVLIKQAPIVITLCIIAYIFYKRDTKSIATTEARLTAAETEIKRLNSESWKTMLDVIAANTKVTENHVQMCERTNRVMEYFIKKFDLNGTKIP